ncbi:putative phage abortive infection protein [Pantoea ananatis]
MIKSAIENWSSLVSLASAVGTVWAAIAARQSAKKAAESAEIARESMETTQELGQKTLKETQAANQRAAFESRYAMLLAHHDHYHQQLCDYLDTELKVDIKQNEHAVCNKSEVRIFFDESIYAEKLDACFSFLTGHQIISRYMRVLYHLLKFVGESKNNNGIDGVSFQKNYTSPLRSTIRNDVLLLIAVNALNVRDERAIHSSYPHYQKLLHDFAFFEHAIFMFPSNPNLLFKRDDWEERIHQLIINKQSDFTKRNYNQKIQYRVPDIRVISPLIMIITIFDNPMRKAALEAFRAVVWDPRINAQVVTYIEKIMDVRQKAKGLVENLPCAEYRKSSDTDWQPVTKEMITAILENASSQSLSYNQYSFRILVDGQSEGIPGVVLSDFLEELRRTESIAHQFEANNFSEGYGDYLAQLHKEKVESSLAEIENYSVIGGKNTMNSSPAS